MVIWQFIQVFKEGMLACLPSIGAAMTIQTADLVFAGVHFVRIIDRLFGLIVFVICRDLIAPFTT